LRIQQCVDMFVMPFVFMDGGLLSRPRGTDRPGDCRPGGVVSKVFLESLILAQENAGGVLTHEVDGSWWLRCRVSGERVSNTWVTCPRLWDNPETGLIRIGSCRMGGLKAVFDRHCPVWMGRAYQLVGGVMAYQGVTGSRPERATATLGLRHGPDSCGRQQWEYCAMGASLTQRRRVGMTAFGL